MNDSELTSDELDELLEEAYGHLKQGRYRMALTAAKTVYDLRPADFNAAICFAWALLENGNAAQALELANYAVQISMNNINARLYRGFLLMRMSIFEGAVSDLDWAISQKPDLLSWAHLNKARALGGLGRFFEGLEEIEIAININKGFSENLSKVREFFRIALGSDQGFLNGILTKKKSLLLESRKAFKIKEYWFSLWAARQVLDRHASSYEQTEAHLLELESLVAMFKLRDAYNKAQTLKNELENNESFLRIYNRLKNIYHDKSDSSTIKKSVYATPLRTDLEKFENKLFNVFYVRSFDLMENLNTGKRTYLLEFNEDTVRFIAVEVVIDNPFYGNKNMDIDGTAVWYLNNEEVGRHEFSLKIKKDWQSVEFVQSWGAELPGFWNSGQGRVEIFYDFNIICARWFIIGNSNVVNFEEVDKDVEGNTQLEKPATEQPHEVEISSHKPQESKSLEELLKELDYFVGLDSVKQSMRDFIDYLKFINERKKHGLKTQESLSIHPVFLGNPGTGKTTVARLLGKIFKAMGLLENGHVIEVDRAGLVGQYIGETAQKTEKVIEAAKGGVLFIDEAYTLIKEGNQQDFGREAVDVLIKKMEDSAGDFIVIVAGYPDEMNSFVNSNPGMKSRFTNYFKFEDYTPEQLIEIFKKFAEKEDYKVTGEAIEILKKEFTDLYRKRDKTFGNARLVRNCFNEAKINLSKRFLKLDKPEQTKKVMTTICLKDIKQFFSHGIAKMVTIGIDEDHLRKALGKLNNLTGLATVKKEINNLVKLAKFYHEQGANLQDKFNSHFVFLGNPGTGKTTVARLFSEIYYALGILPKGHLVEVDRQGLVSGFVGQTAEKTQKIINEAIGGTLFIDEAYALIKKNDNGQDFGKEAVESLLKRMEDDRGKFIVIAAGYTDEMNSFLESNPGLSSRFTKKIIFEDYSPGELMEITNNLLSNKRLTLHEDTVEPLRKYFNRLYRKRDKTFGNARLVRDLVETACNNQLLRIADIPAEERHEETLKLIQLEDIKGIIGSESEKKVVKVEGDPELLEQYLKELSELAGLEEVKKSVNKLVSSLKVAKLRKQRGLKVIPQNLHSVFMGNPGTGKTTVARLLSKIYKELGVLEKGHLIEVDRTGLVAGYQGQTSLKTDEVIKKALGGTLFIDEAYTLSRSPGDFGQEAIDTLIKRMEDYQKELVIIVAGYPNEMKEFINSNPGLKSRFTNYFKFEDYTPRQLLEVALVISEKNGYQLDEGAWQLLLDKLTTLYNKRDKNFGNARTVKNILYKAISNQEERILTISNPNNKDLTTIAFEDFGKINLNEF